MIDLKSFKKRNISIFSRFSTSLKTMDELAQSNQNIGLEDCASQISPENER